MNAVQIASAALAVVVVAAFALMAFRKISFAAFWIVMAIAALFVYILLPRLQAK